MSTHAERRQAELGAKLGLLREELSFWQELAAEHGILEKHHSQLLRLGQVLGSALAQLDGQRAAVESWAVTTEQLLGVHHVWDFFRAKLALRLVDRFRPALAAADELAWACVKPLHAAAVDAGTLAAEDVREPPLVYFDSSGSSFAQGRRQAYRNLLPAKRLSDVPGELVKHLPVPVIGIPWHEQAHLPETAVIAHEAAHIVDDDLGLYDALLPVLEERLGDAGRTADWSRWLPEAIADVLAALRLGPAYGQALADLVTASDEADQNYPPAGIRLQLVAGTLTLTGHATDGLPAPLTRVAALHERDVSAVVETVASTPLAILGDAPLRRFEPFTADRQKQAIGDAQRLSAGLKPVSQDPRLLIAAGVRAFGDDPEGFVRRGTAGRVFARIVSIREDGTRAAGDAPATSELGERDRRLGADLLSALAQQRSDTAGSPSTT